MGKIKKGMFCIFVFLLSWAPSMGQDIHQAVKKGDLEKVKTLLKEVPTLLNLKGHYNRTPVMTAAFARQKDVFKYLVEQGADLNAGDQEGLRPIHYAAFMGDPALMALVISKGADVDTANNVVGAAPIHIAARGGNAPMIKLLGSKGVNLEIKNKDGLSPLLMSVNSGNIETVRLLSDLGASPDNRNPEGNTPLLLAALNGAPEMVKLLLDKGADVDVKNQRGGTPYSVASREGHTHITQLLTKAGAKKTPYQFPALKGPYLGQPEPGLTPVLFAPGVVSTEKRELNAVFTPDGKEFYYTIRKPGGDWVIMVMKQENNRWTRPRAASFSGQYSDVDMFISPDGKKLFYCSNRPRESQAADTKSDAEKSPRRDFDIWYVERKGDGWSEPINPGAPVNSRQPEFYPAVARDGTLYYQSTRKHCFGARDIYRCRWVNGKYLEAENLGDRVNSKHFESDPYIAPDRDMIILSVNRPDGRGRGDLYMAVRQKDGGWSELKHLGNDINTEAHENCPMVSPDGKYLFFTRAGDVYWMKRPMPEAGKKKHKD